MYVIFLNYLCNTCKDYARSSENKCLTVPPYPNGEARDSAGRGYLLFVPCHFGPRWPRATVWRRCRAAGPSAGPALLPCEASEFAALSRGYVPLHYTGGATLKTQIIKFEKLSYPAMVARVPLGRPLGEAE